MAKRVLVVGAGISGLTTAYFLDKAGIETLVLEACSSVGGCIRTSERQGFMLEHGPNSMLVNRQGVLDLIAELGLEQSLVQASQVASKRFIVKGGRLHALPASPWAFLRTPLFSAGDKLRLFREPFIGRGPLEETIAQFAKRRLGKGFYDYAINPFVSGVYAGDPDKLLARAAVRKVWDLEHRHGSMVRGALAMILGTDKPPGRIKGRLLSFSTGMAALPESLRRKLGERVRLQTPLDRLERLPQGWRASFAGESYIADHVVLATPSAVTADLLAEHIGAVAGSLRGIAYAPVAVVHLGLRRDQVRHPLDGFGCLIPRCESLRTLGILFSSTLFPGRSDEVLLTCFIGGATQPELRAWSDDQIFRQVQVEVAGLLGVAGEPGFVNVLRWDQAIPQYNLGHLERIDEIERAIQALGQISTRANWRDGVSVPDCLLNARAHAENLAAQLTD